jgi:FemAB-related protein (PEP-CTERM system-associated)
MGVARGVARTSSQMVECVSEMDLAIVSFSDDDKDLWNGWVASNPWASFYHLWEWGEVLCRTYQYPRYYLGVKRGHDILAVLPLIYIRSRIFANKLVSVPFAEYGGPLLRDSTDSVEIESALAVLSDTLSALTKVLGVDYVDLRQPHFSLSLTAPTSVSTPLRRYVTFRVDLTKSEEELWKGLDRKCRNAVRKAMKSGVKTKEVDADDMRRYYRLYLDTESRHGSPPHSATFFRSVFDVFAQKRLRMTLAVFEGEAIGGIMAFYFRRKLYWFNNVVNRKYARLNPTNLLLWDLIRWGAENDLATLDLGQTRREDAGVYRFKSSWGGHEVPLENHVLMMKDAEIPDPLQRKYLVLSRLWSLLPHALAERVGPNLIRSIAL